MKKGVLIALYAVGVFLSCLAGEQDKTAIKSVFAGDGGETEKRIPDKDISAGCVAETWNACLSITAIPDIAVAYPLTAKWESGMKKSERDGAFGAVLSGFAGKDFIAGWLNCFSVEPIYKQLEFYGILTGLYGYVAESYGIMVPVVNRAENSYGIQVSPFANLVDGSGGGLGVSLLNAAETYSGVQIGLMNGFVLRERGRIPVPAKSFFVGMQTGGVNVNFQNRGFSFQIGLFNRSYGGAFQIGLLNYAENAGIPWLPVINFCGFSKKKTEEKASAAYESGLGD